MAVRLAEVAHAAGVSQATASRVLNGSSRRPAQEVADKVRAAAERLGYVPNAQAQALVRASARLMGLVVHDIADPYFSSIARGAQRGLAGSGIQLMLASTERDPAVELEAVRSFMSHRTDAILLAGSRGAGGDGVLEKLLQAYRRDGGRVAMIGQPLEDAGGVRIDNRASAAALAQKLVEAGHSRFAVLSGESDLQTATQRADGFVEALTEAGLSAETVSQGAFTRQGGYQMMSALLDAGAVSAGDQSGTPLCVFCVNDVMALGALAALREAGLRVPEDVALAGFDDIPTLADQYPTISTVHLPLEEIGRMSAQMLFDDQDGDGLAVVEGVPVLRQSTFLAPRR